MSAEPELSITNVVGTAFLGVHIDLSSLAIRAYGDYDPARFAAAIFRLSPPHTTTALVFSKGRVVITGAASEMDLHDAAHSFYRIFAPHVPGVRLLNIKVQHLPSCGKLPGDVDLVALAEAHPLESSYVPEVFPGLKLSVCPENDVRVKCLIFDSGKVVLTGARSRQQVEAAWQEARSITLPYVRARGSVSSHAERLAARRDVRGAAGRKDDQEGDLLVALGM